MLAAVKIAPIVFGVSARTASASAIASVSVASSTTPAVSVVAGGLRKLALPKVMCSAAISTSVASTASRSRAALDFSMIGVGWP